MFVEVKKAESISSENSNINDKNPIENKFSINANSDSSFSSSGTEEF